jgi:peptidoglycan-N-acetylglucosamine deacetylase
VAPGPRPVFFDPRGRRSWVTNIVLSAIALAAALGLAAVAFGILVAPLVPDLAAPAIGSHQVTSAPGRFPGGPPELQVSPSRNRTIPDEATRAKRFAFLEDGDAASIVSLRRNAAELDAIIPDWLSIARPDGKVELRSDPGSPETTRWLESNASHVEVYPQLTSGLRPTETATILAGAASRSQLIGQIAEYLRLNGFRGIALDFPNLPPTSHRHMVVFLSELSDTLRAEQKEIVLLAPSDDIDQRIQDLARFSDYVLLSLYDRVEDHPKPGPIAGQG